MRKTRGDDIDAACGQLAGQVQDRTRRKERRRREEARMTEPHRAWDRDALAVRVSLRCAGCAASDRAVSECRRSSRQASATGRGEPRTACARACTPSLRRAISSWATWRSRSRKCKEALRSDANYGPAHNVAGLIYAAAQGGPARRGELPARAADQPFDSDANHNYGQFLCQRKREEEGIGYFLAAVKNPLYQTPERSYMNAGVCARRRGDMAAAENYFQLALKTRPGQPQALYQLAEISFTRAAISRRPEVYLAPADQGQRAERRGAVARACASSAGWATAIPRRATPCSCGTSFPDSKEARALASGEN